MCLPSVILPVITEMCTHILKTTNLFLHKNWHCLKDISKTSMVKIIIWETRIGVKF